MFTPSFKWVNGILQAAMIINAPHTPDATFETADVIDLIGANREICSIGQVLVRQAHQHICSSWMSDAGTYRNYPVSIGGDVLDWYAIQDQMDKLHPFIISPLMNDAAMALGEWYTTFERIHPFGDGNGRVGGAIIAGISLAMFNTILIPDGGV